MLNIKKYRNIIVNLLFSVIALSTIFIPMSRAQKADDVAKRITKFDHLIWKLQSEINLDSLRLINKELIKYLENQLPRTPELLTGNYDTGFYGFRLGTSADRKFRIWSWDDGSGGPLSGGRRTFIALAEYVANSGIKVKRLTWKRDKAENRWGQAGLCDSVFTVQTASNNTIYIPVFIFPGGEQFCIRGIEAYRIEGEALKKTDCFIKSDKKMTKSITIEFDCGRVWEEHNFTTINESKTLLVPALKEERMSSQDDIYEFDGEHFIYKRTK